MKHRVFPAPDGLAPGACRERRVVHFPDNVASNRAAEAVRARRLQLPHNWGGSLGKHPRDLRAECVMADAVTGAVTGPLVGGATPVQRLVATLEALDEMPSNPVLADMMGTDGKTVARLLGLARQLSLLAQQTNHNQRQVTILESGRVLSSAGWVGPR